MKKIGLLGGAFDPIHQAHIEIGASAKRQLDLDEIWLLIDKNPRNKNTTTSFEHRLEMARLATRPYDYFVVDRLAMQREGRTYGVQSLQEIKEMYPNHSFTLIAGLDAVSHFDKWESPEVFCQHLDFAIAGRPDHEIEQIENMKSRLGESAGDFRYQLLSIPDMHISSTQIRQLVGSGKTAEDSLHDEVAKYITKYRLYSDVRSPKK